MKDIIDNFIITNKLRYITVKSASKLDARAREFHAFNTWNKIYFTDEYVVWEQMQGKEKEFKFKEINRIKIDEIGKYLFFKCEDVFCTFRILKGSIKLIYVSNIIDRLSINSITELYFNLYKSIGVKCYVRSICFNPKSINPFVLTEI